MQHVEKIIQNPAFGCCINELSVGWNNIPIGWIVMVFQHVCKRLVREWWWWEWGKWYSHAGTFTGSEADVEIDQVGAVVETLRRAKHIGEVGIQEKVCGQSHWHTLQAACIDALVGFYPFFLFLCHYEWWLHTAYDELISVIIFQMSDRRMDLHGANPRRLWCTALWEGFFSTCLAFVMYGSIFAFVILQHAACSWRGNWKRAILDWQVFTLQLPCIITWHHPGASVCQCPTWYHMYI